VSYFLGATSRPLLCGVWGTHRLSQDFQRAANHNKHTTMQLPKMHKSSWVSLLALATLACSAKSPASLGSLTQNHLLFPLAGLKNWLVRRRSHRVDEQVVASCTRKRLDDDLPSTDRVTVQVSTPPSLFSSTKFHSD
jgi:hypothetical protein